MVAVVSCANVADPCPAGACLLSLRRQDELLCRVVIGLATCAGGPCQHRLAKIDFDFYAGHRGPGFAGNPDGFDFLRYPSAFDADRRAALRAGLRPADLTPTF